MPTVKKLITTAKYFFQWYRVEGFDLLVRGGRFLWLIGGRNGRSPVNVKLRSSRLDVDNERIEAVPAHLFFRRNFRRKTEYPSIR